MKNRRTTIIKLLFRRQRVYFVENFALSQFRSMKKIAIALLLILSATLILSSCKSNESCAAYGEAGKYQIERRR